MGSLKRRDVKNKSSATARKRLTARRKGDYTVPKDEGSNILEGLGEVNIGFVGLKGIDLVNALIHGYSPQVHTSQPVFLLQTRSQNLGAIWYKKSRGLVFSPRPLSLEPNSTQFIQRVIEAHKSPQPLDFLPRELCVCVF